MEELSKKHKLRISYSLSHGSCLSRDRKNNQSCSFKLIFLIFITVYTVVWDRIVHFILCWANKTVACNYILQLAPESNGGNCWRFTKQYMYVVWPKKYQCNMKYIDKYIDIYTRTYTSTQHAAQKFNCTNREFWFSPLIEGKISIKSISHIILWWSI